MPRRRSVRMTRRAISPRLATRTVSNRLTRLTCTHIRKTPKRGSGSGARETTSSASPSTSRVSAGSIDSVVPQPRGGVVGVALRLVLRRGSAPRNAASSSADHSCPRASSWSRFTVGEHGCRLRAAHDGDAARRPGPEEPRRVRPAAHRVVAGAERPADHDGELGHARRRDRGDHLRAVLRDARRPRHRVRP